MNKLISKARERGFLKSLMFIFKAPFFYFYKFRFLSCNRVFFSGKFQITGKQYIEIGTFSAGSRIRIDAISKYRDQIFEPRIIIGKNVCANNDIHIACTGNIYIGNNVLLGSNIYLTDHDHGIYSNRMNAIQSKPDEIPACRALTSGGYISIGDNVFIGEYVTILKNVSIGNGCIIGAHSLVNKDIPANSIAIGNPAKVIKIFNTETGFWEVQL